ncbi:MAG: hypothetical protein AAFQ92_01145 [Bacteroidota bacterium]
MESFFKYLVSTLLIGGSFACTSSPISQQSSSVDLASIYNNFSPATQVFFTSGIPFFAQDENGIKGIGVQDESGETNYFFVQPSSHTSFEFSFSEGVEQIEILYMKEAFIVFDFVNDEYHLFQTRESNLEAELARLPFQSSYTGIGIGKVSGTLGGGPIFRCSCKSNSSAPASGVDAECSSGGPGSTTCSNANASYACEVGCGSGYYTCCNLQ